MRDTIKTKSGAWGFTFGEPFGVHHLTKINFVMMKKVIVSWFFLLLSTYSFAQISQNRYIPGEKLKFIIYYGMVNGGYINAELVATEYEGKIAYHSKMLATTAGLADLLYKVRDEYQSYFDPETSLPFKSVRDIREGKYKRYDLAFFDHKNLKVLNDKNKEFIVPADIRDMVSVFYYIRNMDFEKMKYDDIIKVNTFFDNEIFPFDMRYRGIVKIKTKMAEYICIKLVPFVEPGRIFEKEDDMRIYLTADTNRVPVRVEFDLKVGTVKCDLIEYSGLKY